MSEIKPCKNKSERKNGAPERIRTPDLLIRSQALYPAELRARIVIASQKWWEDTPIIQGMQE